MKIWGMSYGLIGDLIMGLPLLTYFEKKYPGSYKYWVIQKKCSMCAPIYFNHDLIDSIRITEKWGGFGDKDKELMEKCDIVTTSEGWKHSDKYWYNNISCVEETAIIAGIDDIMNVLSECERKPFLNKWFNTGFENYDCHTYSKDYIEKDVETFSKNIAIYPFATAGDKTGRSPSVKWWNKMIDLLIEYGYSVYHYGRPSEPKLSKNEGYISFIHLPYFEQLKIALASKVVIGTDSGSMWVIGAYSHPSIHLITNWLPNHKDNLLALAPVNDNSINIFAEKGCDNIKQDEILQIIKKKLYDK